METSFQTVIRLVRSRADAVRALLGYDIFISYARSDGSRYAAGLANRLAALNFTCYLDQYALPRGRDLPQPIRVALERSSLLVVIGTKASLESTWVQQELGLFSRTTRPIVPIDFGGELIRVSNELDSWSHLSGLFHFKENPSALESGDPSDGVCHHIRNSAKFVKRNTKVLRGFAILGILTSLLLISTLYGAFEYRNQKTLAESAASQAKQQEVLARTNAQNAQTEQARAEKARDEALKAQSLAEQQTRVAKAHRLVSEAEAVSLRGADSQLQLLLAYEAWLSANPIKLAEVSSALFRALAQIGGRPLGGDGPCGRIEKTGVIRTLEDKRRLLVEGWSSGAESNYICIWNLHDLETTRSPIIIFELPGERLLSATNSERKASVSYNDETFEFHIRDIKALIFSPNGATMPARTVVAKQFDDGVSLSGSPFRQCVSTDVVGHWLVFANEHEVWIWSLLDSSPDAQWHKLFSTNTPIGRVVLSFDGKWLFITSHDPHQKGILWRMRTEPGAPDSRFEKIAEIPFEENGGNTSVFSPDNRWLITAVCSKHPSEGAKKGLVFWHLTDSGSEIAETTEPCINAPTMTVFSPDNRWLIISSYLGWERPSIWRMDQNPELAGFFDAPSLESVSYDPRSSAVFVAGRTVTFRTLSGSSVGKEELMDFGFASPDTLTISPDNAWIVNESGGDSHEIVKRDLASGAFERFVIGSETQFAAHPTGGSWAFDRTNDDLYYLSSGNSPRATFFLGGDEWLLNVGRRKRGAIPEPTISPLVLPLSTNLYPAEARRVATRNMTHEEWKRYMPGETYRKTFAHLPGQ